MSDVFPDLDEINDSSWIATKALRRRPVTAPVTARARRKSDAALTQAVRVQIRSPLAMRDAAGKSLSLLDKVKVGGPNEHHGIVQVLGFSVKNGKSILHYGVGYPETLSFWCFCAECARED